MEDSPANISYKTTADNEDWLLSYILVSWPDKELGALFHTLRMIPNSFMESTMLRSVSIDLAFSPIIVL